MHPAIPAISTRCSVPPPASAVPCGGPAHHLFRRVRQGDEDMVTKAFTYRVFISGYAQLVLMAMGGLIPVVPWDIGVTLGGRLHLIHRHLLPSVHRGTAFRFQYDRPVDDWLRPSLVVSPAASHLHV
jgi:hypothetical protein